MKKLMKQFLADEQGLETVEYAVMTALIVATLVGAITALSGAIEGRFGNTTTTISSLK